MEFDRLLTPSRLRILAALVPHEGLVFSDLRAASGLGDGNLHVHAAKLAAAGYVALRKRRRNGRQVTEFRITDTGLEALRLLSREIDALLAGRGSVPEPKRPRRGDDSQVWST
ncbi:transcriptional regulator [Candidatus Fermentibacteria bacterium]|nr:transcriptional regulator [Candidatus Fermentibacteria bacterium]